MKTRMKLDEMLRALPYAAELMDCEALKECKRKLKEGEYQNSGDVFSEITPVFLKEKREAFLGLLGAMEGLSAKEVAELDWEQAQKLMNTSAISDLFDFFTYTAHMVRYL